MLQGQHWINDNVIDVAQQLLKAIANEKEIGGLQSPQCGKVGQFRPALPRQKWVQILHVNNNHWIVASNIDLVEKTARCDVVYVYDSLVLPNMSLQTKKVICSLAKPMTLV